MNAPLLSLYELVDLQTAATQAAIIEEVTYVKVLSTGAKQTLSSAKVAVKWVAKWAGIKNKIDATPPNSTAELVIERAEWWAQKEVFEVRQFVIATLAERLQTGISEFGVMSTRIVEEAAAGFGISSDLLLSQQADAIALTYLKQCEKGLREQLENQGDDENSATDEELGKKLREMTPTERLEIQKALNLQTLSATSLREAILKSGVPIAGIAAVQAGGFGAYLALTTVMHAVFTSVLGISLPFAAYTTATSALSILTGPAGLMFSLSLGVLGYFWGQRKIERSQYAMIVATCVWRSQAPLVPSIRDLPSAHGHLLLTDGSSEGFITPSQEQEDYEALERERLETVSAAQMRDTAQRHADRANRIAEMQATRLRRAEERLAEMVSRSFSDLALQLSLQSQLEIERNAKKKLTKELEIAQRDAGASREKVIEAQCEAERIEALHVSRRERRSNELKELWAIHFPNIDFRQQPLRWAAEQDFVSRLEIERALKELSQADDPVTLSRSRMHVSKDHHSGFTIPNGVACRLYFAVHSGRIEVRNMCKKKDDKAR